MHLRDFTPWRRFQLTAWPWNGIVKLGSNDINYKSRNKREKKEQGFHKDFIRDASHGFSRTCRARVNLASQVFISRFEAAPDSFAICVVAVSSHFILWLRRRTSTSISSNVEYFFLFWQFWSNTGYYSSSFYINMKFLQIIILIISKNW